jgi:hypothetical protein
VEVKSGRRTKAKSLTQYISRYAPKAAFTLSAKRFTQNERAKRNLPLYMAGRFKALYDD